MALELSLLGTWVCLLENLQNGGFPLGLETHPGKGAFKINTHTHTRAHILAVPVRWATGSIPWLAGQRMFSWTECLRDAGDVTIKTRGSGDQGQSQP